MTAPVRLFLLDDHEIVRRGLGDLVRRSGLDNLGHRASARGGSFRTAARAPSGTTIDWSVPVVAS